MSSKLKTYNLSNLNPVESENLSIKEQENQKVEINMKFNYIQCNHKSQIAGKVKPPRGRLAQKP